MLEFPLQESFFPQIVLNGEEVKYYKRLGKERLNQLMRIAEDADYAYKWTDMKTKNGATVQKTQFLDFRPATKATYASVLIKSSVLVSDTRPEEVLHAVAKAKTKEYRKMMGSLHRSAFVDGRTLFKFPSSTAANRPDYSYRAIKWCTLRGSGRDESKKLDFSFLEYAGKKKPSPGSMVVGFCVQESIQRDRELPMLESFGIVRGYMSRSGIIISKTHQSNVLRVTSICQIDGDIEPIVRNVLEDIMQEYVASILGLRALLDRQRVSGMKFLEQWEWVANSDRKACAVCLNRFFFHRKHHCRACGEVVCSSCAPLRDLEERVYDLSQMRICASCMTKAGLQKGATSSAYNRHVEMSTSNEGSESHSGVGMMPSPRQTPSEERMFVEREYQDRTRRPSDAAKRLLDSSSSKRRMSSFMKNPREATTTLANLVEQIRTARDTINLTISEAGDSRLSYGEEDAYADLYSRVHKLRETVEHSIKDGEQGGRGSPLRGSANNQNDSISPDEFIDTEYHLPVDQYDSVLKMTFEAALATRNAGELVLSSHASDFDKYSDAGDAYGDAKSPSQDSDLSRLSGSDTSRNPYATSNYDRIMSAFEGEDHDSIGNQDFDRPVVRASPDRSPSVDRLEKKIEALQRDLMNAHRKLSFYEGEEDDVPDVDFSALEVLHEDPYHPTVNTQRVRPKSSRQRPSFSRSPTELESRRSQNVPSRKNRPMSDGLAKMNESRRQSLEAGAMRRRGSEFVARAVPSTAMPSTRASMGAKALSKADMLTELYGVMNSSEITKPGNQSRPGSFANPPTLVDSLNKAPLRGSRLRAPPPPPPVSIKTMYVDEDGELLPSTPVAKISPGLDKTASSSASYAHLSDDGYELHRSRGSYADSGLDSARYNQLMAEEELANPIESSSSSDGHNLDLSFSNDQQGFFGQLEDKDQAFFGHQTVPLDNEDSTFFGEHTASPVHNTRPKRPMSEMRIPRSADAPRHGHGRDESDELRELMEGLIRPRSNSAPFRSSDQMGGSPTQEQPDHPSWSDGASLRRQHQPFSPLETEDAIAEIRTTLMALRHECPSDWERHRKLQSVFKVLKSLHRDGVRSRFRTLNHEDIRYEKALQETPSIVVLLKLAGYVSFPQKLTMRHVDHEYITLFLQEIERAINEMQASQDYL